MLGAGAAGLKVAFDLARKDVEVVVLEANDRVGGRVRTLLVGGERVDLGAESFEAGEQSKWIAEFDELDLLPEGVAWVSPFSRVRDQAWWYPGGRLTSAHLDEVTSTPSAEAVNERFDRNVTSALDVAVAQGVDLRTLEARVAFAVSGSGAFSESIEPSFYSAQDRARNESPGEDARPFVDGKPYGVGRLFEEYAVALSKLRNVTICLPVRVVEMSARLERGWELRLADTTHYAFDALVVTPSVSVLTRPEFPWPRTIREQVVAAFAGIELGAYTKIAMHWPAAAAKFGKDAVLGFYTGPDGLPAWQVSKLANSEVILVALAGSRARDLSESRALEQAIELIQLITKADRFPQQMLVSNWNSAAVFGGAYSFSRVGAGAARPGLQSALIEMYAPVGLFFAGEAFSLPLYGSLEATWYTGADAAERCLRFLGIED
ncbi:MAG TPA: FAD-dependent oxidoreductase [Enhygromyxa sp.]|nr:FAD-dependent oxidoreductase [Enhygromyxa sp.]